MVVVLLTTLMDTNQEGILLSMLPCGFIPIFEYER